MKMVKQMGSRTPFKFELTKLNSSLRLGVFFLTLKVILSYTTYIPYSDQIDTILSLLGSLFLIFAILKKGYRLKTLFLYGFICLAAALSSYLIGNFTIFITIITIFAIRDEENVIKFIFQYESLIIALVILFSFVSVFFGYSIAIESSGRSLFYFGLSHPNVLACLLFNLSLMWSWINYYKLTSRKLLYLLLYTILVYLITGSRTGLLSGCIMIFLLILSRCNGIRVNSVLTQTARFIVPVLSVLFYFLITRYTTGNILIKVINEILTGRVRLGAYAYTHFGLTFLGQEIGRNIYFGYSAYWGMSYFTTFDNLYTMLLVNYGIIWLILIAAAFFVLAGKRDNRINCMILCWALYSISEGYTINGYMCFPILLVTLVLSARQKQEVTKAKL